MTPDPDHHLTYPNANQESALQLNKRGIPVDQNDWTEHDWLDLYKGLRRIIAKIAKRHRASTTPKP